MMEELQQVAEMLNTLTEVGLKGFIWWVAGDVLIHILWATFLGGTAFGGYKLTARVIDLRRPDFSELSMIKKIIGYSKSTPLEPGDLTVADLKQVWVWSAPWRSTKYHPYWANHSGSHLFLNLNHHAQQQLEQSRKLHEARMAVLETPFDDVAEAVQQWRENKGPAREEE